MSVRKGNKVIAGGNSITIDSALNNNSINPVQNSKITAALAAKADASTTYTKTQIDNAFDAVNTTLASKQDTISSGSGITITNSVVAVGDLDCGTMP